MKYSLWIVVLAMFVCGCPKNIPPPDNEITDPSEFRAAVDARFETVETARFKEVVLEYFGKDERFKVRQLMLAKKPSSIRVQTRVPGTEEILNLLVSDGETFSMHRRDTNEYVTGPATRENIARLLPVDLSAQDVMRVMFGGAPWERFDAFPGDATLEWDRKQGLYRYEKQAETTLTIWVRHSDYGVTQVDEKRGDETVYSYTTDDWERFGEIVLPTYRRFVRPAHNLDFSMDVGETQINADLPDILFDLPPPEGSKVVPLQ